MSAEGRRVSRRRGIGIFDILYGERRLYEKEVTDAMSCFDEFAADFSGLRMSDPG